MSFRFSKTKKQHRSSHVSPDLSSEESNLISSYVSDCQDDAFIRSLCSTVQERTNQVIRKVCAGPGDRSLSVDAVKEFTGYLTTTNQEVVKLLHEYRDDILKNDDLYGVVKDYFENSYLTLKLCNALEKCLDSARDSQLKIQVAVELFEKERRKGLDADREIYFRTRKEFKNCKTTIGNPFTKEFSSFLQHVYESQCSMLDKLQAKKILLDKKLKKLKGWRTVSNAILVLSFSSILICAVVSTAITAPPAVAVVAAVSALPLGSMAQWINSLWENYVKKLKKESEIMSSLDFWAHIAKFEMENIVLLIDTLDTEIESLLKNADFALKEKAAVTRAIVEIKKKLREFTQTIEDLSKHTKKCSADIMTGRGKILETIIKQRNK
ncbi:UPF0496 protein At2g18630-like [Cornus florida]|uniref:UPF0496 protein At2g18630-like n=1 Tax=Cornus florida TaxID=4283 RepID=UPI00289C9AB9|nr:UPF0496 protein At2g18630-like [Cornus florida]